jgi:hypothetical protein
MEGMMRQLQCEMEALQLGCTADYRELGAQILAQADAETAQFEGRTETVKPERPLAVKANAALRTILHDEPESRQIGEGCECRGYQPFTYYTKSRIRIVVLPQDSPSAETTHHEGMTRERLHARGCWRAERPLTAVACAASNLLTRSTGFHTTEFAARGLPPARS